MRELVEAVVIASLEDILHDILEIAPPAGGIGLAPEFVKCLPGTVDVFLNSPIAAAGGFIGVIGADVDDVVYPEKVTHAVNRLAYMPAELTYDSQHRRFSGADIAPDEQSLVRVEIAVIVHHRPMNDVGVGGFHLVSYLESGTDLLRADYEKLLVPANPR